MTIEQIASQVGEVGVVAVTCRHYWIVDPPDGPVSQGVCRYCDEVRDFKNFLEEAPWQGNSSGNEMLNGIPIIRTRNPYGDSDDY